MQHGNSAKEYPLAGLAVVLATAGRSPVPGLVRVSLDITPDEAYALGYRCDQAHQAGFAGRLDQAAFWAVWGVPVNATRGVGIMPQRRAHDPGE